MRCMILPGTSSRTLWPTFRAWLSTAAGPDRVRVEGGDGTQRTGTLKVSVGYVDSYVGEGQISYAGPGAVARGQLALEIVEERLRLIGVQARELRFDLIGVELHSRAQTVGRCAGTPRGAGPGSRPNGQPRRGCPDRERGGVAVPQWPGQRRRRDEIRA